MSSKDSAKQDMWSKGRSSQDRSTKDRLSQVRKDPLKTGPVRTVQVRTGEVTIGYTRTGQGQVRVCQVRIYEVRTGQVESGQIRSVDNKLCCKRDDSDNAIGRSDWAISVWGNWLLWAHLWALRHWDCFVQCKNNLQYWQSTVFVFDLNFCLHSGQV